MIWLIGNKGMLGHELADHLLEKKIRFVGTDREVDILDPNALKAESDEIRPSMIINCSAYTAVDKAEEEIAMAFALNKEGVANIARLAEAIDIPVIHISTDYVFDGTSLEPLAEDAPTNPIGIYGKSKLAGEQELVQLSSRYYIIRTAWLYGKYGKNFVDTMLALFNSRDTVKVVDDQIGSPTWTRDVTELIISIIESERHKYGVYHISGGDSCTWREFAEEIYRVGREQGLVGLSCLIQPCSSSEFPTPASRPAYSLLSKKKVKTVWGYYPRTWNDSLLKYLGTKKLL